MVDAPAEAQVALHIINYLDWQREGQRTLDAQRPILLEILAQILESIDHHNYVETMLLGGETLILSDISAVDGSLLKQLIRKTNNTLRIGPWYTYLDGLLTDGETYIRNLLLGLADAKHYGIPINTVAIMPNITQIAPQLPQILRGFGIDTLFAYSEQVILPLPFVWRAPDGSTLLVVNHQTSEKLSETVQAQGIAQPDGPFIWMHLTNSSTTALANILEQSAEVSARHSTLNDLAKAVRSNLPDEFRPKVAGELHLHPIAETSGRFSGRIAYKQAVLKLESQLRHFAEPLFAISQTFGTPAFPSIQKSLLDYSWRLLMQNMSYEAFAGAINDDVYDEVQIRNRQIDDNSQRVISKALDGLSGTPHRSEHLVNVSAETYITVWNPHGHQVEQIVEVQLDLPTDKYPNVLIDPDGVEHAFTWDAERSVIDFRATVPSVGYVVYTLKISQDKTAAYNQRRAVAGRSIGSASGASLGLVGGRLDWTFANGTVLDLLNYYDGGDAGDIWQYQAPQPDVIAKGSLVDVVQVESTPTYERLIFRNRMRIAPNLKDDQRVRGLRVLDLTTTATYYNDLEGVHFRTQFTNSADDHRLRVHLRTGIKANHIHTDSPFGLVQRAVSDTAMGEQPMQSLAALYGNTHGLGLFTRGLTAFEPIVEGNQVTLALSLLRSVGWLNKQGDIQAKSAQMPQEIMSEFMLMPLEAPVNNAALLRTSMSYKAPLRAIQYSEKPQKTRHSYIKLDNDNILMTALKTPQNGHGLVMRLLNASEGDSGVHIQATETLTKVGQLSLAEVHQNNLPIEKNQVNVSLEPHQITTIQLIF